jgi:hypothetical protein
MNFEHMFALLLFRGLMIDDEMLRKEKFRCDYEGADGVTVGDLFFKAANPEYNRKVFLKKGEYILTELLDFADLKKSRLTGALSKFIEMGWIVVENPSIIVEKRVSRPVEMKASSISEAITEVQAGIIQAKDITNLVATSGQPKTIGYPTESHPKVVEALSLDKSRNINSLAISEAEAISSTTDSSKEFDKFNSLRYFQKLKTIKETKDLTLLELIASKSNYPQLVHNSKNRLRELQTSR